MSPLSLFRLLLFPFSIVFYSVVRVKNFLYDHHVMQAITYPTKVISIGNIRIGGTGKTPLMLFLLEHLSVQYSVGVLSKGYKRKMQGTFHIDPEKHDAEDVGDEAFLLAMQYPQAVHAVSHHKQKGIDYLLQNNKKLDYVLLDDAYHHREIVFDKNILLMDYNHPFYADYILPVGNLRETSSAAKRADIIIITKCKSNLLQEEAQQIRQKIKPIHTQHVFFSSIEYAPLQQLFQNQKIMNINDKKQTVIAVHGIAQPAYLLNYLHQYFHVVDDLKFPDHHHYTQKDVQKIIRIAHQHLNAIVVCTEKDAVKLKRYKNDLEKIKVYALPIKMVFLFSEEQKFKDLITS